MIIILIGPIGAGKTIVGEVLSQRLGCKQVSLDLLRFDYYEEIGYSRDIAKQLGEREGFGAVVRYWKPFEAHSVERVLSDYGQRDCVVDFGAGHSVYEDEALFERVQRALAPFPWVVLLLPSLDIETSLSVIHDREPSLVEMADINRHFLSHPSNQRLAKHVVCTADITPRQVADEILAWIKDSEDNAQGPA